LGAVFFIKIYMIFYLTKFKSTKTKPKLNISLKVVKLQVAGS